MPKRSDKPTKTLNMKIFKLSATLIIMCAAAIAVSCGQRSNKKSDEKAASDTTVLQKTAAMTMDLSTGFAQAELYKDSMQSITLTFDSPGNEVLFGRLLLPEGEMANIRFNQIIMPDSSMDGPFGRYLTYDLASKGLYSLIIGESLMADNPYAGKFIVELYTGEKVPYTEPKNYFVRNDIDTSSVKTFKIASKEELETVLGMATTIKSRPTPIDFSKEFVIVVAGKPTDVSTQYEISALMHKGGTITVVYQINTGDKMSYSIRPFLLLAVDKKFDGMLRTVGPVNL